MLHKKAIYNTLYKNPITPSHNKSQYYRKYDSNFAKAYFNAVEKDFDWQTFTGGKYYGSTAQHDSDKR